MSHNEYETTYILRPQLAEDEQKRLLEKFTAIIEKLEGEVLVVDDWGRRRMAYNIKKHEYGHYTYLNYVGPAGLPGELERNMRIEDNLIRFLTVALGEAGSVEDLRVAAQERINKRKADAIARAEREAQRR